MRNAAIAQPVERILGKDEVASSNLASSSKKKPRTPTGFRLSSFLRYMVSTPKTDTETDTAYFYPYFSQSFPIQGSAMIAHQNAQIRILHIVRNVFAFEIVIPPKP